MIPISFSLNMTAVTGVVIIEDLVEIDKTGTKNLVEIDKMGIKNLVGLLNICIFAP